MRDIDFEFLTLLSNIINYFIFVFIAVNLIKIGLLNVNHAFLTVFGLVVSVVVQLIAVILKKF